MENINTVMESAPVALKEFLKEVRELAFYFGSGEVIGGRDGVFCANMLDAESEGLSCGVGACFRALEKKYSVIVTKTRYDGDTDKCYYTIQHDGESAEYRVN